MMKFLWKVHYCNAAQGALSTGIWMMLFYAIGANKQKQTESFKFAKKGMPTDNLLRVK